MVKRRWYVAGIPIKIGSESCSSSLYHLYFVNLILVIRISYGRAILQIGSDHSKICVGFGIIIARFQVATEKTQHTVGFLRYPVDVVLPG